MKVEAELRGAVNNSKLQEDKTTKHLIQVLSTVLEQRIIMAKSTTAVVTNYQEFSDVLSEQITSLGKQLKATARFVLKIPILLR